MGKATLSILGLYNYDDTIFDGFNVPDGMSKEVAVSNILFNCAELEILYSDWDVCEAAITNWSLVELPKWTRAYTVLQLEYNPIDNYDRTEIWTDTNKGTITSTTTGSSSNTGTSDQETQQTGYNSNSYVPTQKITTSPDLLVDTESEGKSTQDSTVTRSGHVSGNIGITTTQYMIKQEMEIAELSVYDMILNSFKKHFCLLVY